MEECAAFVRLFESSKQTFMEVRNFDYFSSQVAVGYTCNIEVKNEQNI